MIKKSPRTQSDTEMNQCLHALNNSVQNNILNIYIFIYGKDLVLPDCFVVVKNIYLRSIAERPVGVSKTRPLWGVIYDWHLSLTIPQNVFCLENMNRLSFCIDKRLTFVDLRFVC